MLSTLSGPWRLWMFLTRSVRPTYGALANAAEGLVEVRRTAREHAELGGSSRPLPPLPPLDRP